MNLGIDFGSTYTTVSSYDENAKNLEAFTLQQGGSPCIPSVLATNPANKEPAWGIIAKNRTGRKNWQTYSGFKMLLSEKDWKKTKIRGYDTVHTPAAVAETFLRIVIQEIIDNNNQGQAIHTVVVGVPEVWFRQMQGIYGRGILQDIFRQLPGIDPDGVTIVSEPACASAFFAYNYMLIRKKPFHGHILLIDYGGGTLDINLTDIMADPENTGSQYMEIRVLESTGAGENTEGEIGQAGILYMETVVKKALSGAGILQEDVFSSEEAFYKMVNELEQSIVTRTADIKKQFQSICDNEPIPSMISDPVIMEEYEEEIFDILEYNDNEIPVSYATLLKVYGQVIYPVLQSKLEEMEVLIRSHAIDTDEESFKIALVGGFGNYYLVRKQIEDFFRTGTASISMKDIIRKEEDRERAISYGAALLASGIVGIRKTAPYSIGFYNNSAAGIQTYYAFRYKQEIEYNLPYYIGDPEPLVFQFTTNSIEQFVINTGRDENTAVIVAPCAPFRKSLDKLVKNRYQMAKAAFSLDDSEILRLHVKEVNPETGGCEPGETVIELARFDELFRMQPQTPVYRERRGE